MSVQENLESFNPDVFEGDDRLYNQHAPQKPQIIQREDNLKKKPPRAAIVIAESGEWEETRNPEDMNVIPNPEKMVRLKPDVAREHGLQCEWNFAYDHDGQISAKLEREKDHDVPKGGCKLYAEWDMTLRPTVW